ncbi:uncharacterized protein LOC100823643 isoform X2 [Brachypodium distachyon]|uniref:Uncharacterized protein n=1 Tax=Brachypodium distachyon TaxID=15368 RepID=I1J1C8_BRADI|nr:uncharacterized protein LOC100823643 isoform X2 [Brachypodium distachyon]KQJ84376.1 hypothetical protein BRADI_5g20440v3 [Brachypodium distachyon]|eukprot:XP_010240360.1 uncharacterized protein LOC100823643 isoform X2 [Brachypodium distachyon]
MAALRCYPYSATIIPRTICSRTLVRASMDSSSSSESKQASSSVSFTCKVNKVYEDKNKGILCYTDGSGELVCEGLDEGPRLTWQDMENLSKERTKKISREGSGGSQGGIDWSNLQTAAGMGRR